MKSEKKSKIWLWVIGWLLIFPLPLTILLLRKKSMKPALKYGIIAVAWILYLIIAATGSSGKNKNNDVNSVTTNSTAVVEQTEIEEQEEESTTESSETKEETEIEQTNSADEKTLSFIIDSNQKGEYGFEKTLNAGTEFEETKICYHVPVGKYSVKNFGDYPAQVSVCSDETLITEEGWEEPASTGGVIRIDSGETGEISIDDGYYVEIGENEKYEFTMIESKVTINQTSDDNEELKKKIEDEKNLVWCGNVDNDVTNNWRLSKYESNESLETFAVDYYKAYFTNDSEIHAVINMTNGVTGKISVQMSDTIDVTLYEYISGEENDAKVLFGGNVLGEYWITVSTGEIKEIR